MDERDRGEVFHQGQGVSPGVAYGPAYVILPDLLRTPQRSIADSELAGELERLESALRTTRADIRRVKSALESADKARGRALRQPEPRGERADGRRLARLEDVHEHLCGAVD